MFIKSCNDQMSQLKNRKIHYNIPVYFEYKSFKLFFTVYVR